SVRLFFEPRFGRTLDDVRVHTSTEATAAARGLKAHAFTLGSDVAFAHGKYTPETGEGKRLLAHELAHVLQQRDGRVRTWLAQRDGDAGAKDDPLDAGSPPPSPPPLTSGTAPDAGGEVVEVAGLLLSTSPEYVQFSIEEMVREEGPDALEYWPKEYKR